MLKHLQGLDTLRAIAALIVVWGHIELLINRSFAKDQLINISPNGHLAVILFFVLSGFLITYLLVKEKEKNGSISLKNFYLRRILRIWPVYYIVIISSFLLIKADYSLKSSLLCLSIFPNIAHSLKIGWPSSPQIWSIGVEEQFYMFWPLLFIMIPAKKIRPVLLLFFIGYSILPHAIGFINNRLIQNDEFISFTYKFFYSTKFNCMAIGAFLGYSFAKDKFNFKWLQNKLICISIFLTTMLLWFSGFELKYFTDEVYSVLFGIMILSLVKNPKIKIDTKISSFLGRISYGIYMYHWIVILIVLKFIHPNPSNIINLSIIYILSFSLTVLVSWLSHISVERFFLKMKKKYEFQQQDTNRNSLEKKTLTTTPTKTIRFLEQRYNQ